MSGKTIAPNEDPRFNDDLRKAIIASLRSGPRDFQRVLAKCYGADPTVVYNALESMCKNKEVRKKDEEYSIEDTRSSSQWLAARSQVIQKLHAIAPPNPKLSQWWFSAETCDRLARRLADFCLDSPPVFLGTPFLAMFYSAATSKSCTVLDIDPQVLAQIGFPEEVDSREYNAETPIPSELLGKHAAVAIDPPWYPEHFAVFLKRARLLCKEGGLLFCVIPGTLTRTDVMIERNHLIGSLLEADFHILSIDNGFVSYIVPEFETMAYEKIAGFDARSWRRADLVVAKMNRPLGKDANVPYSLNCSNFFSFTKGRHRIFVNACQSNGSSLPSLVKLTEDLKFSSSVSTRISDSNKVNVWTSKKKGFYCTSLPLIKEILSIWSDSAEKKVAVDALTKLGLTQKTISYVDQKLGLWPEAEYNGPLRKGPMLHEIYSRSINEVLASQPKMRQHSVPTDGYRTDFSRDRDRIIWSRAFKRLVGKTQVFPLEHDEMNRSRATHTLEVKQLAHTIAESFGLDARLTEAVSLAHDIGHPPFGHAGEDELDSLLSRLSDKIGGFNHYEQGVDALCWLEDAYLSYSAGGFPGLNLTPPVYEGVFKHCYFFEKGHSCQNDLYCNSKYSALFKNDYCHLEGQAVRAADKICYLVEDIEDALRAKVISLADIMDCTLFHKSSIDMEKPEGESDLVRFISQRRAILSVLMTDLLEESNKRLASISSEKDFRNAGKYCITQSAEISQEMTEVWRKVQSGKIHKNIRVQQANARAAYVIGEILVFYILNPHLVDPDFVRIFTRLKSEEYFKHYRRAVGSEKVLAESHIFDRYKELLARSKELEWKGNAILIPLEHIIQAKSFVASMTDKMALKTYRENIQGIISND